MIANGIHPHTPFDKQQVFLDSPAMEAAFTGLWGAGATEALLMAAVQWAHIPGYNAVLFVNRFDDLLLPSGMLDRALYYWFNTEGIEYDSRYRIFTFYGAGRLKFDFLENETDRLRHKSTDYHFIGFDNLQSISERDYKYMFSRLRRPLTGLASIPPLQMRSTVGLAEMPWPIARFASPGVREINA